MMALLLVLLVTILGTLRNDPVVTVPGLSFQPTAPKPSSGNPLIWTDSGSRDSWSRWSEQLQQFLVPYTSSDNQNHVQCDWDRPASGDQVCYFDVKMLGLCSEQLNFGYSDGQPCVAVMLDKVLDWVPVPYNATDLPEEMPDLLKQRVRATAAPNQGMVWLSCDGENPADKENIGPLSYYPRDGFPTYFFPYKHQAEYLSPIVMVQFGKVVKGVIINVECKAWASNIKHHPDLLHGRLHFELLVD